MSYYRYIYRERVGTGSPRRTNSIHLIMLCSLTRVPRIYIYIQQLYSNTNIGNKGTTQQGDAV